MHHFLQTPRQIRSLLVICLLSFVICLPVLSQPLGLSFAWDYPVIDADNASESESAWTDAANWSEPTQSYEFVDEVFNRSFNENIAEPTETQPTNLYGEETLDDLLNSYRTYYLDNQAVTEPTEPVYLTVDYYLYISANHLNLRLTPSTDSEIISELKFGDKVLCTGENNDWMQVEKGDLAGYIKAEYTSRTMVFENVKQTVYVDASKLNLRKEPSTGSEIIVKLSSQQKLTRTGIGDNWSRVRTSTGKTGYVASEYLTTKAPVSRSTSGGTTNGPTYPGDAGRIVELAYSALGVPYVHCGSSLSSFDCSGLTSWAYRQIGITIPRSTSGYYTVGRSVSFSDIQPADIICMDTKQTDGKTTITHVGIYVGNGMMIHASSTMGKVVLQNVNQYFGWGVKLICVRRILD
jgi:cell wall-associated NlpC family hydrolase